MAELRVITASQIINFDDDSDEDRGILSLEVDSREDGLNAGKTSFQPGDSVGLLLYRSPNVRIVAGPILTAGSIAEEGIHITDHVGFLPYAGETSANMSHPICTPALEWLGQDLGPFEVRDCSRVLLTDPPEWNPALELFPVGILKYEGTAVAQGYRLTNTKLVTDPPYQIGVYFFGIAE